MLTRHTPGSHRPPTLSPAGPGFVTAQVRLDPDTDAVEVRQDEGSPWSGVSGGRAAEALTRFQVE